MNLFKYLLQMYTYVILFKLYTLNMYSLLHISYILMQLYKKYLHLKEVFAFKTFSHEEAMK